ncbi:MAG: tRNA (adenosine(37)-N6)-dimethylallyltransferase MiaA [Flammeovirgaceae bacterium]|nr:tRNA (adenosine(37)-N6)-dimethylallyltransferase MiaA [Flammeovirgaceae bacterium]
MQSKKILLSIVGPTASGKTALSLKLAEHFKSEIVSADSRQFYKELTIGTSKPTEAQMMTVRHHFVNSHSIKDVFNVGSFEKRVLPLIEELMIHKPIVVMVGGSGLYCKAVWEGLDEMPEIPLQLRSSIMQEIQYAGLSPLLNELLAKDPLYYAQVDKQNTVRIVRAMEVIRATGKSFSSFRLNKKAPRTFENIKIGIDLDREVLYSRIDARMDGMVAAGLFDEVKSLLPFKDLNALQTLGYSEIFGNLAGDYDREETLRLLKRNSRRYTKRQLTWFQKDPEIEWVNPNDVTGIISKVMARLRA